MPPGRVMRPGPHAEGKPCRRKGSIRERGAGKVKRAGRLNRIFSRCWSIIADCVHSMAVPGAQVRVWIQCANIRAGPRESNEGHVKRALSLQARRGAKWFLLRTPHEITVGAQVCLAGGDANHVYAVIKPAARLPSLSIKPAARLPSYALCSPASLCEEFPSNRILLWLSVLFLRPSRAYREGIHRLPSAGTGISESLAASESRRRCEKPCNREEQA